MTWKEQNTNEPRGDYETIGCLSSQCSGAGRVRRCEVSLSFILSWISTSSNEGLMNRKNSSSERERDLISCVNSRDFVVFSAFMVSTINLSRVLSWVSIRIMSRSLAAWIIHRSIEQTNRHRFSVQFLLRCLFALYFIQRESSVVAVVVVGGKAWSSFACDTIDNAVEGNERVVVCTTLVDECVPFENEPHLDYCRSNLSAYIFEPRAKNPPQSVQPAKFSHAYRQSLLIFVSA